MTDAPHTPAPAADSNLDHLAGLHRMSRTAGLGSSEYTAVNVAAVVAVLIGAASGLALISPVFLVLPLVGVVVAGVAIRQIASSNRTQTGLPLAIAALVLSIGLAGVTGLKAFNASRQERNDYAALDALMTHFGKLLAAKQYDEAYALTEDRFQENVKKSDFVGTFESLSNPAVFGPLQGVRTNQIFGIDADPDTGLRMAIGYIFLDYDKRSGADALRTEARYRYGKGEWKIFAIPQLFGKKAPAPGAAPGGTPAGPAGPPA